MEILQSNKGGFKLCYEGFIYTSHALRKTKQWWKRNLAVIKLASFVVIGSSIMDTMTPV